MKSLHIKKLSQKGVLHHIIPIVAFVVLFGAIGGYFIFVSQAATTELEVHSSGGPYCMTTSGSQVAAEHCSGSSSQAWSLSGGYIRNGGSCLGPNKNKKVLNIGMVAESCGRGSIQEWSGGANDSHLTNEATGYCLSDPDGVNGAQLQLRACNSAGAQHWTQTSLKASGGSGGSGGGSGSGGAYGAEFVQEAKQFDGVPYLYGGGHLGSYTAFKRVCPSISKSNPKCEVDCSGLVSMTVDAVLGTQWDWTIDGTMTGSGSSHWHAISMSSVKPGDIVTNAGHVEFVYSGSGSTLKTIGAHQTGTVDGVVNAGSTFNRAYEYE